MSGKVVNPVFPVCVCVCLCKCVLCDHILTRWFQVVNVTARCAAVVCIKKHRESMSQIINSPSRTELL